MTKDYFDEPLPPGVKNLDNYEIDFPEHNLKDYVMYSPKSLKQSDTNYDKDIQVDNVFIDADKHDERINFDKINPLLKDWVYKSQIFLKNAFNLKK